MLYTNYFYEYYNQIINIAVSDKVCVFLTKQNGNLHRNVLTTNLYNVHSLIDTVRTNRISGK
jgi:hypothetical protein